MQGAFQEARSPANYPFNVNSAEEVYEMPSCKFVVIINTRLPTDILFPSLAQQGQLTRMGTWYTQKLYLGALGMKKHCHTRAKSAVMLPQLFL